jgi:NAD(P)H dehydrogenase (quinone)
MSMIVITGATGKLGTLVVERLLSKVPASGIGVSVRDPEKAANLQERGIRVRRGDFAQPFTLENAFEGATHLLMISSNAGAYGGNPEAQHRAAIQAAQQAGVQRIVYTSQIAASVSSAFAPMWTHARTETMLAESGLAWTALRNGFYADAALMFMGREWKQGRIAAPLDGKVAWTTHADLADAAAAVLTGEAVFEGPTPPLTASQSLDLADLGALSSTLLQRPIERKVIDDSTFRQVLLRNGMPEQVVAITLGFYEASRSGEFDKVDTTLSRLLKRDPTTMRQVLLNAVSNAGQTT